MSIHSRLVALWGSSALGSFAPYTISRIIQHYVVGPQEGSTAMIYGSENVVIGNIAGGLAPVELALNSVVGPPVGGVAGIQSVEHILLAGYGLQTLELVQHTIIGFDYSGYGYDYGENYGGI